MRTFFYNNMCRITIVLYFHQLTSYFSIADPISGIGLMRTKNIFNQDKYPFVVSIGYGNGEFDKSHFCNGVLISSKHVLTAAHCKADPSKLRILLGSDSLEHCNMYKASSFVTYDEWINELLQIEHQSNDENDIAIITLTEDVDKSIKYVSRINNDYKFHNKNGYVVSWSADTSRGGKNHKLLAPVRTITNGDAQNRIAKLRNLPLEVEMDERYLNTITVGDVRMTHGDSGCPLFDDHGQLLGIFVGVCEDLNSQCSQKSVDMHIIVSYYSDFVQDTIMQDAEIC